MFIEKHIMKQATDFASAFKKPKAEGGTAESTPQPDTDYWTRLPSRRGTVHIGGHFDPAVQYHFREMALECPSEDFLNERERLADFGLRDWKRL